MFTRRLRDFHPLRWAFPDPSTRLFVLRAAPLSLATTRGIVSFPQGTKMFQFPWFPRDALIYLRTRTGACPPVDFSIRTSPAQTAAHTSPELFAVYRVLRRHLTPQAFTVRPCSFSQLPLQRSTFSRVTTSFALLSRYALVNELSVWLATPLRLSPPPPPRFSPGEVCHTLRAFAPRLTHFCG